MYRNSSSGTANNYQSLLIIYIHTFVDKKNNFVYIKKKKNLKVDPEPKEKASKHKVKFIMNQKT